MTAVNRIIDELRPLLGSEGILTGDAVSSRAAGIWRTDTVAAAVILRPADTSQVAAILRACHDARQSVVVHGGLTGLSGGAIASADDLVLSTERLTAIEAVDAPNRSMRVQSGVPLATAQQAAADVGLQLALDLGARGSCTVGGNAATNAGGNNVLRYGMAREQILGVEAVLADGTVVSSLNEMLKNNAGYDLGQLFIGTEGTLGVITRLVMRLRPPCSSCDTALLAVADFTAVGDLLRRLERDSGGTLTAFEVMWRDYYELVAARTPPLPHGSPYYVLAESQGNDPAADTERFVGAIVAAQAEGIVTDAVVCKSGAERDALWALRENVELTLQPGPATIFDVSLPFSAMEGYVQDVSERVRTDLDEQARLWVFGHVGDGNLHLIVATPGRADQQHRVERCVYEPLSSRRGSVSAEHGIGLDKKPWLPLSRSDAELDLMRRLKVAFDPRGILNPGRIVDVGGSE